jgi:hypothetical protein
VIFRRRRFAEVIDRQLRLFVLDNEELLRDVDTAKRFYDRLGRDGAEERYGDYADLVDTATELLADLRDAYSTTLAEGDDAEYEAAFNRAVLRRWPQFGLELEDR